MKSKIICLILLFFIFAGAGWLFYFEIFENRVSKDCQVKVKEVIVRGGSLQGFIEDGQTVKVLYGYYNCHKIERGDVVLYDFAGRPEPVIKIVQGIDGDKFQLKKVPSADSGQTDNGWNILINDEIVKNTQGIPYSLGESGYRMLHLYEKDYKGKIPDNAYLLLGNLTGGSLDSTMFGLIDKSDILGKVEYP